MNGEGIITLVFIFSFIAGVCLAGFLDWLKERIRYVKRLKTENQRLRQENSLLLLEIHTRGL